MVEPVADKPEPEPEPEPEQFSSSFVGEAPTFCLTLPAMTRHTIMALRRAIPLPRQSWARPLLAVVRTPLVLFPWKP